MLVRVLRAFGIDGAPPHRGTTAIPEALLRTSDYLTHPVFHMNRAEAEMMRYMRRLSDRDLALDRAMVIGLCVARGGPTSHVAILAATIGLPALVPARPRGFHHRGSPRARDPVWAG